MKRIFAYLIVLAVVASSTTAFAASPAVKFKGGVKDVLTSPLQVSDNMKAEAHKGKFMPFALGGGMLKGGFYMGKQIVTGSMHIVTSPLELMKK